MVYFSAAGEDDPPGFENNVHTGKPMTKTVRRVVTGHDSKGEAIILMDGAITPAVRGAGVSSALLWVTDETPADISGDKDRGARQIGVPPPMNGSICRIVDFPPVSGDIKVDNASFTAEMGIGNQKRRGGKHINHPFMHRTKSIDYAIVLEGEIDMLLDNQELHLKAGDVLVQQGTNHAWVNNSGKPCRICFVLIGAHEPDVIKGDGGGH
jgi:mannose-6-phosphate isomerase-like protein (cupin superfamily)